MLHGRIKLTGWVVSLMALLVLPLPGWSLSPYETVQQGNTLYQAGQYDAAAQHYATAGAALPDAAEIHFNQGNTSYKQQDYDQALAHYTRALRTTDRSLEGQAKYNLGNVKFQQALQAVSNPQDATKHLRSALTYYRDSLEVDPQRQAAHYNLELAHRLLRQLQQEQKQQKQQKQQNEQDQEQDQQEQEQQGQQQQAQDEQQQEQQDASQAEQEQQDGQSSQQANASEEAGEQPQQATQSQDLSPDEAERLLETIRERAREAEDLREQWRGAKIYDSRVDKDW